MGLRVRSSTIEAAASLAPRARARTAMQPCRRARSSLPASLRRPPARSASRVRQKLHPGLGWRVFALLFSSCQDESNRLFHKSSTLLWVLTEADNNPHGEETCESNSAASNADLECAGSG